MKVDIFEKHAKTINEGKVKYKTKEEKINETKFEFKANRFTNTHREDIVIGRCKS